MTRWHFILMLAVVVVGGACNRASGQDDNSPGQSNGDREREDPAANGYTLIAPMHSRLTYLINVEKSAVQTWSSSYQAGKSAYLLPNGNLLRSGHVLPQYTFRGAAGGGGRIQILDASDQTVWNYSLSYTRTLAHHDIEPLPNGNVLVLIWEHMLPEEVAALGRDPDTIHTEGFWMDGIIEVKPIDERRGQTVWEWSAKDHIVQDLNEGVENTFGKVEAHPELIDLNYANDRIRGWLHINSIDYNEELDQILLSVHGFDEIWIIDHGTTTAEAASHKGGRCGKGGDLLYRWGNPAAYRRGGESDQKLFQQHDARWVEKGCPGESNITVFNNGATRPGEPYSSIEELAPPVRDDGTYKLDGELDGEKAFGPEDVTWRYEAPDKFSLYSARISGAQRLPNGNTLICDGSKGRVFQVNRGGETVWEFQYRAGVFDEKGTESRQTGSFRPAIFKAEWYPDDYPGIRALLDAAARQ